MRTRVSIFNKSRNINIKDSSLTVNVGTVKQDKLDLFFDSVSLNAILNAGGRADEVRCYPGTREEIIEKVERWMDDQNDTDHRMLWLSGHAGAGKSAIAQTVAERGADRKIQAANFFFFRGENARNHARPLVSTLVYQLVNLYPSLREYLTECLIAQPLAYKASVGEQFAQLLASPIENARHSLSMDRPIILIIDGLDECDDETAQVQILSALHALVNRDGSPFRVMVASRTEPHLVMFFNNIASSLVSIFLNAEYRPEDDIQKFVIAKFEDIKRTHHLAHTLGDKWPTREDISEITSKSSGQFIYAATVMRFIEGSKDSPSLSLRVVHQLRPPTTHSPFAQLDALYSHVFSKARDIQAIKWAFGMRQMESIYQPHYILLTAGYEAIELDSLFADISSIAQICIPESGGLDVEFYHASLPDYLKDKSRSGEYHVDKGKIAEELSIFCLPIFNSEVSFNLIIDVLASVENPTTDLAGSLVDASNRKLDQGFGRPMIWDQFIRTIIELYFATDKALCGRILRCWLRFAYAHQFSPELWLGHGIHKTAYRYYRYLQLTEKVKFVLRRGLCR